MAMKKMDCPCLEAPKAGDVLVCVNYPTCTHAIAVLGPCGCEKSCVCHACCGECMVPGKVSA